MRFLLFVLSVAFTGWVGHQFLPWYAIVVAAALCAGLSGEGAARSFAAGFAGAFLLWGAFAAYFNLANEGILATRVGALFGGLGPSALVLVTAVLGGLFGGLGALLGSLGRKVLKR